ncbi:MAG: DUF998 domain-containing protein [Thermoproteus sp.]|nr:DUF998 domain-containing protein [Thermoproteus sp.]
MGVPRALKYSGLLASATFWAFTAASIAANPWFNFLRDAFSDLGGPRASQPWIYNAGLVVSAVFLALFSLHMVWASRNKVEAVGGAYMSVAAVFLALIGVFHAGTRPHVFVSTWFFVQAFFALLIYGVGKLREDKRLSYALFAAFALALMGALAVPWPSAAALEAYEVALLTAGALAYSLRSAA